MISKYKMSMRTYTDRRGLVLNAVPYGAGCNKSKVDNVVRAVMVDSRSLCMHHSVRLTTISTYRIND